MFCFNERQVLNCTEQDNGVKTSNGCFSVKMNSSSFVVLSVGPLQGDFVVAFSVQLGAYRCLLGLL